MSSPRWGNQGEHSLLLGSLSRSGPDGEFLVIFWRCRRQVLSVQQACGAPWCRRQSLSVQQACRGFIVQASIPESAAGKHRLHGSGVNNPRECNRHAGAPWCRCEPLRMQQACRAPCILYDFSSRPHHSDFVFHHSSLLSLLVL